MTRFERELSGEFGAYWQKDAQKRIAKVEADIISGDMILSYGVATWKSNGRCIMDDMAEVVEHTVFANMFDREATRVVRDEQNEKLFAEYRAKRQNYKHSEEELAEMRSVFGKGAKVVDVITGNTITL